MLWPDPDDWPLADLDLDGDAETLEEVDPVAVFTIDKVALELLEGLLDAEEHGLAVFCTVLVNPGVPDDCSDTLGLDVWETEAVELYESCGEELSELEKDADEVYESLGDEDAEASFVILDCSVRELAIVADAEIVPVHVFVTVCLINVNVWEGVELKLCVFVAAELRESVDVVLTVAVVVIVLELAIVRVCVMEAAGVREFFSDEVIVVEELDVFDCDTELVSVFELVDVLELDELPENVVVPVLVLDWAVLRVFVTVPVIVAVWDGLLEGACAPVLVGLIVLVIVWDLVILDDTELQEDAVDVLLLIPVTVEVAVTEGDPEFLIVLEGLPETLIDCVRLKESVEHMLAVDVLLLDELLVLVLVTAKLADWVPVAVWVRDIGAVRVRVDEAVGVLLCAIDLVWLGEAEEVFVDETEPVVVLEFTKVLDIWGVLEVDVDPVDVLEPRIDKVAQAEDEDDLDDRVVLEFVVVELEVLDWVVEAVSVLDEVVVFVDVPLPVVVRDAVFEFDVFGVDEEVFDVALVFVGILVGFIVTDGNAVGVIKEDAREL